MDEFLQSSTNQREDQYGGSAENRVRFLLELVDALCTVYPASRVGVKLSPNGNYNNMGSADNIETYTLALQELDKRGVAYVQVQDGLGFGFHEKCEPFTIEMARKAFPRPGLICNVGYDRDSAEAVISAGHADAVAFGRPFISNPDLVYRYAHDLPLAENSPNIWFTHDSVGYVDFPPHTADSEQ